MLEELFKDVNTKKDRQIFLDVLKFFENNNCYDIINDYTESAQADIISFIGHKAKIVGESELWRTKKKIFIKKTKDKDTNTNTTEQADYNFTQFTGQPIKLFCGEWIATDDCIYKIKNQEIQIASTQPITITRRMIDIDTEQESVELAYKEEGQWKTRVVSRNTIANPNTLLKLASFGIEVAGETNHALSAYLHSLLTKNKDDIPLVKGCSRAGWTNNDFNNFIPYVFDDIETTEKVYCSSEENKQILNCIEQKGDYQKWLNMCKEIRSKGTMARIILASSFASPLLPIVEALGFVTHLYGDSGSGKSLSLMLGMSIWGNPAQGKLFSSINNTLFSMELKMFALQNVPFAGDELQNLLMKERNYDSLVYMISNGVGRGRGNKELEIVHNKTWKLAALTTGEDAIIKDNSHSGASARVLEVYANEDLFPDMDGRKIAQLLTQNYGYAGKEFIRNIIKTGKEEINRLYDIEYNELKKKENLNIKQINVFALVLLADKLANKWIFKDDQILDAEELIKLKVIKDKEDVDVSEKAFEYILGIFSVNKNKFCRGDIPANSYYEVWGEILTDGWVINKQILKRELERGGYSLTEVLRGWTRKGYIKMYGDRPHYHSKKFCANVVKIVYNQYPF